jgi:hypothetical protein
MDYRSLLAVPLAALALSASGADTLRQPTGWHAGASFSWPGGKTHEAGVAPDTENSGQRALTVKSLGERKAHDIGSISQGLMGYAGKRVRFSAQVMTAGVDHWAGLVVGTDFLPLHLLPTSPEGADARGAPGCPGWCDVSVVADIPADSNGVANVGLALVGSGQVWARNFRLEIVGKDVPVTEQRFGTQAAAAFKAMVAENQARMRKAAPDAPQNLALR